MISSRQSVPCLANCTAEKYTYVICNERCCIYVVCTVLKVECVISFIS